MFKEIIASALFSFSISAPVTVPTRTGANNLNTFSGSYCLKEYSDYDDLLNDLYVNYSDGYEFEYSSQESGYSLAINSYTKNKFELVTLFSLSYSVDSAELSFYWKYQDNSTCSVGIYYDGESIYGIHDDIGNIVLYFTTTVTVGTSQPQNDYDFFSRIFTKTGNPLVEYYNGWYTFTSTPNYSFQLFGTINANNSLYNYIERNSSFEVVSKYYPPLVTADNVTSYTLYGSSTWNTQQAVYLTYVLIPSNVYGQMSSDGTFNFIPPATTSEFKDLMFAIADTPFKMLADMFHFELLGIDLGIALLSILTLLLVVVVLKKII